ncbi:hypothetical protein BDV93DRAFT_563461 [Ceratobasidium sp. AG-I]|nr:hypothetical protein BDV93DRAFT_563461 [Ceratobasidium sp. AG-I]
MKDCTGPQATAALLVFSLTSTSPPPAVATDLRYLRVLLSQLPDASHPTGDVYPFPGFVLDDDWVDITGSVQGSVNHSLEVAFGSRATAAGEPIRFKSHGSDLIAVVGVLSNYITGEDGENPILINWVADLVTAAANVYTVTQAALPRLVQMLKALQCVSPSVPRHLGMGQAVRMIPYIPRLADSE